MNQRYHDLLVALFDDPIFVQNFLVAAALAFTTLIGWCIYRQRRNVTEANVWRGLGIIIVTFSIGTSFGTLIYPGREQNEVFGFILTPTTKFAIQVLVKMLVLSWGAIIFVGLSKPERVSKIGAKFLGFEFNQEFWQDQLSKGTKEVENLGKHLQFLAGFNEEIAELMMPKDDDAQVLLLANKPNAVRRLINDRLLRVYQCYPKTSIYVLPDTIESFGHLDSRIRTSAESAWIEDRHIIRLINPNLGIAVFHALDDLGAIIIIDSADRIIEQAEVTAVGIMYMTIMNLVETGPN